MEQQVDVIHHEEMVDGPRGLQIFRQSWTPSYRQESESRDGSKDNSKANIVLVHGLAEHSGRYQTIVRDLCQHGYSVYSLDHLGHGKSQGERCCINTFADYRQPLHDLIGDLKTQHPSLPVYLLGHSMGGLISANYLLDHEPEIAGAILSAPAVLNRGQPSLTTVLKLIFYSIFKPNKGLLQLDASGVSRNPAVVTAYLEDPLVYNGALPACLLVELSKAMRRLQADASDIHIPLLILQGDKDKLVDPTGAKLLFDRVASADKELENFPACYHEILNEEEYPQILQRILRWLDQRIIPA